jgi:hypothetical protein
MAIGAMAFACHEEIQLPSHLDLGEHGVPYILKKDNYISQPSGVFLQNCIILLTGCKSHTLQSIAYLHFMIPVIEEIIQMRYVI